MNDKWTFKIFLSCIFYCISRGEKECIVCNLIYTFLKEYLQEVIRKKRERELFDKNKTTCVSAR